MRTLAEQPDGLRAACEQFLREWGDLIDATAIERADENDDPDLPTIATEKAESLPRRPPLAAHWPVLFLLCPCVPANVP
jgi:hypothetical protein